MEIDGIDDGSAPLEEQDTSAGLFAERPYSFRELIASNMAMWRGGNKPEDEPKLTGDLEWDGVAIHSQLTLAEKAENGTHRRLVYSSTCGGVTRGHRKKS